MSGRVRLAVVSQPSGGLLPIEQLACDATDGSCYAPCEAQQGGLRAKLTITVKPDIADSPAGTCQQLRSQCVRAAPRSCANFERIWGMRSARVAGVQRRGIGTLHDGPASAGDRPVRRGASGTRCPLYSWS